MSVLRTEKPVTIAAVIEAVRSGDMLIDDLCVYVGKGVDYITLKLVCYLDRYPKIAGDVEVYSDFVTSNDLDLIYYGQQFNDVLNNILDQKATANLDELVSALNYYLEHDDFIDIYLRV